MQRLESLVKGRPRLPAADKNNKALSAISRRIKNAQLHSHRVSQTPIAGTPTNAYTSTNTNQHHVSRDRDSGDNSDVRDHSAQATP